MKRLQHGLGMITAIIILVILASLATAMVAFGTTQHLTSAQDVLSIRAWQAAKAGNEWGLYMTLNSGNGWDSGAACTPSATVGTPGAIRTKTIDLTTNLGFTVAVKCSAVYFNEGEVSGPPVAAKEVTLYTITSTATNGISATSPGYVERNQVMIVEK